MENRKKRKLQLGGAMLALGSASLVASTFLREGGLRWVCACATVAFMILAIVSFVRASSEPD
ncbi:MAG: hypothetical protein ABSH50_18610 [Bryobacteraceae bacterium]|jgi:hypothetical protein